MRKCDILIPLLGYCFAAIIAGILYGTMSVLLVFLGGSCTAFCIALISDDIYEDVPEHDSCDGCKHDLGGGQCKINLEAECGKGEHEAWEGKQ